MREGFFGVREREGGFLVYERGGFMSERGVLGL